MSDELKDQRIPIMMSPSEVKAIDDWMFSNRIKSRAEAIRRLCQLGIVADCVIPEFEAAISALANKATEYDKKYPYDSKEDKDNRQRSFDAVMASYKIHVKFFNDMIAPILNLRSSVFTYKGKNVEKNGKIYNAHEVLDTLREYHDKIQRESLSILDATGSVHE